MELPNLVKWNCRIWLNGQLERLKRGRHNVDHYIKRIADEELARHLETFGAVLIEGPKWCGKTTTAMRYARSSLLLADPTNDFEARTRAEVDPLLAITGETPRLIDEWQEVPKLWDAVRFECDRRGGKSGQYIMTGSATPKDAAKPMHSGAGRISRLRMDTMTLFELGVSSGVVSLRGLTSGNAYRGALGSLSTPRIAELVVRGGWPSVVGLSTERAALVARQYIDVIAEEDISQVDNVRRDPEKVRALIRSLARNESTLASLKTVTADLGGEVTRQTAATYLSVLSRLHFIDEVPAWNPAMRSPVVLRSAKKRHFIDSSLAAAALGASIESLCGDIKTLGLLFESLVLHDLGVYARAAGASLYHYHDMDDLEADAIVAKSDGSWVAIEIKLGAAQIDDASDNLARLESKMVSAGNRPPAAKCVIIGFGAPAYVTDRGIQVIPVDTLGV